MNKQFKILLGITLIILTVTSFFVFPKQTPTTSKPFTNTTAKDKHIIEIRDDGFNPKTITVKKGETVTFKTTLNKSFWPASDSHPTHLIYPGFDPKNAIAPAKTWSFRFDKVEKWVYHDHLSPYYTGEIIVTP